MKKILLMTAILFVTLAAGASFLVRADENADLTADLEQAITQTTSAVELSTSQPAPSDTANPWVLKRFWLRMRPRAAYSVPGLAKFQVTPEAELLFSR